MHNRIQLIDLFHECTELPEEKWNQALQDLSAAEKKELLELLHSDQQLHGEQSFLELAPLESETFEPDVTATISTNHAKPTNNSEPANYLEPTQELSHIGDYQILNIIAVHGQGAVYRANHPHLNRQVVIKVSKDPLDDNGKQLLIKEGQALARLDHPNLAKIYDLQIENDCPYLVIEFIEGSNLSDLIKTKSFSTNEAITLMQKLTIAMSHAHQNAIVHRDLKPANVVIRAIDQEPKIIDFGLAHQMIAFADVHINASRGGTLCYMPPEQARGISEGKSLTDQRSDIFALGAIMYELLTGQRVYKSNSASESIANAIACDIDFTPLEKLDICDEIKSVCKKALSKDPQDRFPTAKHFAQSLQQATDDLGEPQTTTTLTITAPQNPLKTIIASVAILVLITFTIAFIIKFQTRPSDGLTTNESPSELNQNQSSLASDSSAKDNPKNSSSNSAELETPNSLLAAGLDFQHRSLSTGNIIVDQLFRNGEVIEEDQMRMDIEFDQESYCFFFAVNPDGNVQLCYPEDEPDFVQVKPIKSITYPGNADQGFEFTDGAGQMAFLIVKSATPLPSFNEWRKAYPDLPAAVGVAKGKWRIVENEIEEIKLEKSPYFRGKGKLKGAKDLAELLNRIESKTDVQIEAITFPVVPKRTN